MRLSDLSIRRPVLAIVFSIVIVIFGLIGFRELGVREYPAVDPPIVTVTTNYAGANPEIIDSQITEPLEQAVNGIAGIRTITSDSREGQSTIKVEFTLETDLETAANDVRDKVSQAVRRLPPDADPPTVEKADADSEPIIFLAVQSDTKDILEVSNIANTVIKERVQTIPGVSAIRIFGEKRYAMRLWLDPDKMAAHGITPIDIQRAIDEQNVDLPSGRLEGTATELALRTAGRLDTADDFNAMVIREVNGRQILLRDIGYAELSAENLRTGNKSSGLPMIGVAVIPQPNTNAIAIADEFFRRLEQIKKELPADYKLDIGFDFTLFVRRSVLEVQETLLIAFGLVTAIIFLFLRDWRSTLIPVIAIPISIVSTFFVMYIAGFSINILTLVGLVLAIGLVCDDAIVVLENVYSKIEQGMTPFRAAVLGAREIYFAVISTTITLAAVFLPIIFLQGQTGRLFREFGVVVAGAVLVSAFIALSLSPMMCRFLLKPHGGGWFHRVTEPFFVGLNRAYRATLRGYMAIRWITLPLLAVLVGAIVWAGNNLKSELAPLEDRSSIRATARAPEGASYDYTLDQIDRISAMLEDKHADSIYRIFAITGRQSANVANLNIYLKQPDERTKDAFTVFQEIAKDVEQFDGLRVFPALPPTIGGRMSGQPVQFVLQAPNLAAMLETLPKFLEEAGKRPELRFVDADLKVNRPQVNVQIDRARATELGVSVRDIARVMQFGLGDQRFGYFLKDGRQYQVMGQLERRSRNAPDDLRRLYVRNASGDMIALDNFITLKETISPSAIYRYDRFVSATVSAGLAPGYALGDGIEAMRESARAVLPESFSTALAGQSRDFAESGSSLLFAFVLAIVLIYLVLAAQFESFMDPFIILISVPVSISGALLTLHFTGQSLNIFSQIGIIMLIGLVTKNGILIVEFANQRKEAGLSVRDAVMEAAVSRFRPILMTSLATILGVLPIAVAFGGAAGSRRSLGIAVIGGLVFATFLTLYIVPAIYSFLSAEFHRRADEEPMPEEGTIDPPRSEPIGERVVLKA